MLWVDKYEPTTLTDLTCHADVFHILNKFAEQGNIRHLLFYGPSGAGKGTRVKCLLRGLYGDSIDKVRVEELTPDGSSTSFTIRSSNYHTELYAATLGLRDKQCLQMVLKQSSAQQSAALFAATKPGPKYRVFVVHEAHFLSLAAQASLRRTMEKYSGNMRVILVCERLSSIIAPLKSRCFCVRVPAPSIPECVAVLKEISLKADVSMNDDYLKELASKANRNLRAAIILLQRAASKRKERPAVDSLQPTWRTLVADIVTRILQAQTPQSLLGIRDVLGAILVQCIDSQLVLEQLIRLLLASRNVREASKLHIMRAASHFSTALDKANGVKDLIHLEAFIATAMVAVK